MQSISHEEITLYYEAICNISTYVLTDIKKKMKQFVLASTNISNEIKKVNIPTFLEYLPF